MAEALFWSVLSKALQLLAEVPRSASSSSSSDPRRCLEEDLKQLTRLLPRIKAVLRGAEEREVRDEAVKLWLTELEDVAYDAEDVLDEYQYEVLRAQVEGRAAAAACRKKKFSEEEVCGSASSSSSSLLLTEVPIPDGMADRIREIRSRFDEISRDREALRLREEDGERRARATYPPPTGHLIDESAVYGREQDKKKLIHLLLSENKENTLSVIPVVGTGRIGKTTLAQLVYNDLSVKQHFSLSGWVCVSEDFDIVRLTRAIIESITKQSCGLTELSSLQETLREKLNGKRVLLVLDDVWNEQRCYWESLQAPFLGCSGAVSIIVTTRNLSVAEVMQTVLHPCRPGYLAEDQCWLLFQRYAFRGRDPSEYPTLVEIGKQIVKRCRGLPLAVKTLGGLLQYESEEYSWENILQSDLWQLHNDGGNGIFAALRLSYNWMPAYLKPCFLYLSMYPKDHQYNKDEVVWLWIANGYIQPRGSVRMEDVGKEYFEALLKRSILEAKTSWDGRYYYLMHDMVHDLARSISGKRCLSISVDEKLPADRSQKVQHLYVEVRDDKETADYLSHSRTVLRTLLAPEDMYRFPRIPLMVRLRGREDSHEMYVLSMIQWTSSLRALCLVCMYLDQLPDSIGYLKHLRYLHISSGTLQRLPDSICLLYNLQILRLETPSLVELPRDIGNLINLYYINVNGKYDRFPESISGLKNLQALHCRFLSIRELPIGIGDLSNLRCLHLPDHLFVYIPPGFGKLTNLRSLCGGVSARTENMQGGIGELKDLANIEGSLTIKGLRRIGDIVHAKDANLKSKHGLEGLLLSWEDEREPIDVETEEMVLESLQPHPNLKRLEIFGYGGARFPSWLGDPSFSKLTDVFLCRLHQKTANLPSLGQLPSLASLTIRGMFKIPRMVNFPSLTKLNIYFVDGLEEWCGDDGFPCLRRLEIANCPNLMRLRTVPSLEYIDIDCCGSLTSLVLCDGLPSMLQTVKIELCWQLASVVGLHKLDSLEELRIIDCHELWMSLEKPLPPKLRAVSIVRCWKLTSLAGLQGLTSLTHVYLERCPKLQLHPNECLQSVPERVEVIDCPRLIEWCKAHQFTYIQKISAQEALTLSEILDIPSEPEVENPPSLKHLCVKGPCEVALPTVWLPSTLETLDLLCCNFEGSLFLLQNQSILKRLKIDSCEYLSLVVGLSKLHSLEELEIVNCPRLQLPQEEPLPPKLRVVCISCSWELTSLAGLQDITSLRSLYLKGCPELQLDPNICLRSVPDEVEIIDCPRLMDWCKTHQFTYIQHL